MLRAHSVLWHYLFVAPNLLLFALAALSWRLRQLQREFPVFLAFAVLIPVAQLTLYAADLLPWVGAFMWWKIFWTTLLVEALIKFALVGEIFSRVVGMYSSLARVGKLLISGVGVVLVFVAVVAAAYTPKDNIHWIVSGAHLLEQTTYLIECGLVVFLFVFAAYFRLSWERSAFGIALGLGVSACVHLATWALAANGNFPPQYRGFLDFPNMAAYHACVLIWFYYLLVPQKVVITPAISLPQHNLELWNRELERLLQR